MGEGIVSSSCSRMVAEQTRPSSLRITRGWCVAGLGGEVETRERADGVFTDEGAAADAEHRQREMRGVGERRGAYVRARVALHSCKAKP